MRISDWSSDVCSSDLRAIGPYHRRAGHPARARRARGADYRTPLVPSQPSGAGKLGPPRPLPPRRAAAVARRARAALTVGQRRDGRDRRPRPARGLIPSFRYKTTLFAEVKPSWPSLETPFESGDGIFLFFFTPTFSG